MKIEESYRRQKELEKQLYELAKESKDDRVLLQIADQLKGIYADGFRHNYSQFFPLILEIFKEDNEYNQDYLSDNLERIRAIVEKDFFETDDKDRCKYVGLYKPLTKLADHINLEIGRRSQSLIDENRVKDLEKRNEFLQTQLETANLQLSDMKEQLQKSQKEYVTILGIFAAVVLTFTGGIAFSTSVLNNISAASIYRIISTVLVIGLVLIDTLFFLFSYVDRIVNKPAKRYICPLIMSNIIIGVFLGIIFFAWNNGFVEQRNQRVEEEVVHPKVESIVTQSPSEPENHIPVLTKTPEP